MDHTGKLLVKERLKIPFEVMKDVGPASQTFGGLLHIHNRGTFMRQEMIAERSFVPLSTARKHLQLLHDKEWITKSAPRGKRTCEIHFTQKARENMNPFGLLPFFACREEIPWRARAYLAFWFTKYTYFIAVKNKTKELRELDVQEAIEKFGYDRMRLTVRQVAKETGLSLESVVEGRKFLVQNNFSYNGVRIWEPE